MLAALPALVVLALFVTGPVWERFQEEVKLRTLAEAHGAERARALVWLVEHRSLRGIAIVLDEMGNWDTRDRPPEGSFFSHYLDRNSLRSPPDIHSFDGEFRGMDALTLALLRAPCIQSAIPSASGIPVTGYERELERVLREGGAALRAQALWVLFRVKAPSSVEAQRDALEDLRRACPALERPLSRIARAFEPEEVLRVLHERSPDPWVICAAGVLGLREALRRLGHLSGSIDRDTALAGLRALEHFQGREADVELARCLLYWGHDVYRLAGEALFRRNPELLLEVLSREEAPEPCRWWQGLMLARLGSVEAVPVLVSELSKVSDLAPEMFQHLEVLARPEHREIILELPERVRPDQRRRAEEVVRSYLARPRPP